MSNPDSFEFWSHLRIVLIETTHPGNIGAVARAMKNMGLTQLWLVNPARFPDQEATRRASGATEILASAVRVDRFEDAVADCTLVVGASARDRRLPWPMLSPESCAAEAVAAKGNGRVALLFGREDRGLTNDELQRCHYHMHIPANPEYSSLNLAMAVQVTAYELRKAYLAATGTDAQSPVTRFPRDSGWDVPAATVAEVEGLLDHLERTVVAIGFHDPERPRQLMARLRRLFQRARLDRMEVNILRGILRDILKQIPDQELGREPVDSDGGQPGSPGESPKTRK